MNAQKIISSVNSYLHEATVSLVDWLNRMLPRVTDKWWDECVLSSLSYSQREMAETKNYSKLSDFDLAALLRIANKSWYNMRTIAYLPTKEREVIREMMTVRNNWAHCSAELPGKDIILHDLNTISDFIGQIGGSQVVCREIDKFIMLIEQPDSISDTTSEKKTSETLKLDISGEKGQGTIHKNSLVYLVGSPETRGIVVSSRQIGSVIQYEVFVNNSVQRFFSGQISLVEESAAYDWRETNDVRSYLTAYQINHPSSQNLYSLNSARIDFVLHQKQGVKFLLTHPVRGATEATESKDRKTKISTHAPRERCDSRK